MGVASPDDEWLEFDLFDYIINGHSKQSKCFIGERQRNNVIARAINTDVEFDESKITYFERCENKKHGGFITGNKPLNKWHLPLICSAGGTMNTAFQLVWNLDQYDDIAVIGCDLGIQRPTADHDPNHFHSGYKTTFDYPEKFDVADDMLKHIHKIASKKFKSANRRIVNCGIGGALEVHDRMKLSDWIEDGDK